VFFTPQAVGARTFSLRSINSEAEEIAEPILRPKRQTRLKEAS
jgi:hypothetical protein